MGAHGCELLHVTGCLRLPSRWASVHSLHLMTSRWRTPAAGVAGRVMLGRRRSSEALAWQEVGQVVGEHDDLGLGVEVVRDPPSTRGIRTAIEIAGEVAAAQRPDLDKRH